MKDNLIKLVGVFLAGIVIVVLLVRSTLLSAAKKKPLYSVYLKIMTNHVQTLGIISSIDFDWPEEV